jgi:hypothetical protein
VRHADIEEEIVECGVYQCKGKNESPVATPGRFERAPTATGNKQNYQTSHGKSDTCKQHLATRHVGGYAKGIESHFD